MSELKDETPANLSNSPEERTARTAPASFEMWSPVGTRLNVEAQAMTAQLLAQLDTRQMELEMLVGIRPSRREVSQP